MVTEIDRERIMKEARLEFKAIAKKLGATEKVVGDHVFRSKHRTDGKYLYVRLIDVNRAGAVTLKVFRY